MKPVCAIVKRQLASNRISFLVTASVVLLATTSADSAVAISNGNYTWLLAIMAPFFIVYYDGTKLMHLGASKKDCYIGSMISYVVIAGLISLVNTGIHLLIDPLNTRQLVINMMDLCGWWGNGVVIAWLQQLCFLLLVMIFLHVLLSIQPYWYGWVTDGILAAILCIFIPIAKLRHLLAAFFRLIMFHENALPHILVCLVLSAVLMTLGVLVIKRRTL